MLRIKIIAVGKLGERALRELAAEYIKRLGRYCALEIAEVRDEAVAARESEAGVTRALALEAGRLMERLRPDTYVIALDMHGKAPDSVGLSALIKDATASHPEVAFIIGGSHGLHTDVLSRAGCILSISNLTFPHQLARLILLEQLYRSFKIINNETYHK